MGSSRLLILAGLLGIIACDSIYRKVLLNQSSPGVCLDGSPAAHYVSEGTGANKTKFLLYFEGGLVCAGENLSLTLESCIKKAETNQGSSKYLPDSFDGSYGGIISGDPVMNPTFHDWTRMIFLYCDGSMHQGHRTQPVSYKGYDLYFRGQNITQERFNWLNTNYALNTNATDIILAGSQDGGIAAIQWGNHLQAAVKASVKVVSDSAILLDVVNPTTKRHYYQQVYSSLMKITNIEVPTPNLACNQKFSADEKWRCMFFENQYPTLSVPLFTIDTLYDVQSFSYILSIDCVNSYGSLADCNTTERQEIQKYRTEVGALLVKVMAVKGNGAWAPACVSYGMLMRRTWIDTNFEVPAGSIYTCQTALSRWYLNVTEPQNHKHVDSVSWPNNKPCSGVTQNLSVQ